MKTSRKYQRIISLLCALLMVITILPVQQARVAQAAATKYESCLYAPEPGTKHSVAYNKEDVCSQTISLGRTEVKTLNGWVLSTKQINYYQIYFVREKEPAPRKEARIAASSWDFSKDTNVGGVNSGFYQYISSNKYCTTNSKWEYVLDSSWMLPGNWTVYVKGHLVSGNTEISVAKINLKVNPLVHYYANGGSPKYITCNDEPNPSATKKQTSKSPSVVTVTQPYKVGPVSGAVESIHVHGWVLHEDGVQSYSYQILNSNGVQCGSGTLSAYLRPDLEAISKKKNLMPWGLGTAGYTGSINISKLDSGKYTIVITGKTLDGLAFSVAKINIQVILWYKVTCHLDNYDYKKTTTKYYESGTVLDLDKTFGSMVEVQYGFHPSWTCIQGSTFRPCSNKITVNRDLVIGFSEVPNTCKATFTDENGNVIKQTTLTSGKQTFASVCTAPASKKTGMVFVGWLAVNDPKQEKNAAGKDKYRFLYLPDDLCVVDNGADITYRATYVSKSTGTNDFELTLTVSRLNWLKSKIIAEYDGVIEDTLLGGASEFVASALSVIGVLLPLERFGRPVLGAIFSIAGIGVSFFGNDTDFKEEYDRETMKILVDRINGYIQRSIDVHASLVCLKTTVKINDEGNVEYRINDTETYY